MDGQELSWRERGRLWLRLGIRLALAALAWLLLTRVGLPLLSLLMPFVLALCVAWLLNPLVRLLQRRLHLADGLPLPGQPGAGLRRPPRPGDR